MVGTNKALGQHWLKNRAILEEIAGLAGSGRLCLEIGPGLGFLTSSLLKRFDKVVAVEYDERLATNLPKSFPGKNLRVVHGDILDYDFRALFSGDLTKDDKYVIAGNIPYYITSPILEKVLTAPMLAERVVLLVQKEVAERILSERETQLSLFVKNRSEVKAGPVVPRDEFTPLPKVDSQVIILEPHLPIVDDKVFTLIKKGFLAPRKKLVHNLAGLVSKDKMVSVFAEIGIDKDARPGDLKLEDWQKLYDKSF